jgi:predicted methyltransferase
MRPNRSLTLSLAALALIASACAGSPADTAKSLDASLAGAHRSDANRARDAHRHPKQTLEFFGLRDDMTVIELWPGSGWYTEVLAPVLRERGKLVAAYPDAAKGAYYTRTRTAYEEKLKATTSVYDRVQMVTFHPPEIVDLGQPGSADMVLTFRNLHNWAQNGKLDPVFLAAFKALKPGGVFGVVEHRAKPDADDATVAKSGYMREDSTIKVAESVGFKLVAKSEINANPKDTKDYEKGVWTLPPSYRLGEVDKDKYAAIGESDRMTLKFIKPLGK